MTARTALWTIVVLVVQAIPAHAGGRAELQEYFSKAAGKVKATDDPSEKRAILNESFQTMSSALDMVQHASSLSRGESEGIHRFNTALRDKQDELSGNNGFERVPDEKLNAFSDYVVQDMEQAAEVITISVVTLLLIIILIVLLV